MPYEFLEDISRADVAFEATADSLEELMRDAARAVTETQVDIGKVQKRRERRISVEAENVEELLYKFLDELIFIKDTEQLVFCEFDVAVEEKAKTFRLRCRARGEKLHARHQPKVDVKAVTMHHFFVRREGGRWRARVVLDV
jgi:SHS2 domain-containing protein